MGEQMTRAGFNKLKEKLETLKKRRARISQTIGAAREEGDLKENSGYHAAKEEQGLNEMRIKELEAKIEDAEIVNLSKMPKKDCVRLNTTVKLKNIKSKEEFTYTLVSSAEADVFENKIATDSPIGSAIVNCKKGETVTVEAPAGTIKYKIVELS